MTTPTKPVAHAGVHFPPPFIYLIGLLAGGLIDRWRSAPIAPSDSLVPKIGGVLGLLVYLAIFLSAFAAFRRSRTTIIPNRPASAIVTDGPYRFTRNPMYISLSAFYLGVMFFMNTWWPLLFLPVVLVIIDRSVIAREERYLRSAFAADYEPYAARVRRWL